MNLEVKEKRTISLERAKELKSRIEPYLEVEKDIESGLKLTEKFTRRKKEVMELYDITEKEWDDWKWQNDNRITDVETLEKIIDLTDEEREHLVKVGKNYRWAISPYYASLMSKDDPNCPIRMRSVPSIKELMDTEGILDPMAEEYTNPAPQITRRYPDRLIINVTNECAMYCRHCQRRRNIGEEDKPACDEKIQQALDYVRDNPEIRDVLVTGGDPFTLNDDKIEWILSELHSIPHVEVKRFGSATPVTMPQRITENLCNIFSKYLPVYVNTHFNHPKEVTLESKKACFRLAKAGVALGNQAVLLKGINNDPHVMKKLNHNLLQIMVKPYYIFHAKPVKGTAHFIAKVEDGIEIMEHLRGYTSGLAIPWYIINAPEGHGKTPIVPQYLISFGKDYILLRNWEGMVIKYPNKVIE